LLRESLSSLPRGIIVARRGLRIVRQNLRWAAFYNIAAIPIAALGFMPPWVAALGMSLSSMLVVFNAQRILYIAEGER
jgi:Cu2+-exporting ATPase